MNEKVKVTLWTVLVIVLFSAVFLCASRPRNYIAEKIFAVSPEADVAVSDDAHIVAAGNGYFQLASPDGTVFSGVLQEAPFGWEGEYFFFEGEINQGKWRLKGLATTVSIRLTEEGTVSDISKKIVIAGVLSLVMSFIVWCLGMVVILGID